MRFIHYFTIAVAAAFLSSCSTSLKDAAGDSRPRTIVTCDPELDDNNSLIRFLMFSDGYDTEGIIYASSQFHWKGDGKGGTQYIPGREYAKPERDLGPQTHWRWAEGERFIDDDIEAYEKVYPNLKVHNPNYPTPEYLKSLIREGNVAFEGDMAYDTPGSDLIKTVLLDDDPRPVFIQVWGGPSTVSRALKSIQEEYEGTQQWQSIKSKVSAKAKLCLSGLQDQTYNEYIVPNWPEIESVVKNTGVTPCAYGAKRSVHDKADTLYYSAGWIQENILGKGPLSDRYRVWGDGQQMSPGDFTDYFGMSGYTTAELVAMGYWVWTPPQPKGEFISEGDSPEFLNLIANGLRAWEDSRWGGWAGRETKASAPSTIGAGGFAGYGRRDAHDPVLPDFIPAVQNNFAARLSWCTASDYSSANHEPVIKGILSVSAKAGDTVLLKTKVSDPDSDNLTCQWRQFKVMDSYQGDVMVSDPSSSATSVTIPPDAVPGDTIHMVLTVQDDGSPSMTSYLRTVITIK